VSNSRRGPNQNLGGLTHIGCAQGRQVKGNIIGRGGEGSSSLRSELNLSLGMKDWYKVRMGT